MYKYLDKEHNVLIKSLKSIYILKVFFVDIFISSVFWKKSKDLNFQMKNLSLNFDNRTEAETVSILHFLEQRGGREAFVYNVPTIYAKTGQQITEFIAPNWEVEYNFYNNYSIRTTFEEVPA